MRIPLYPKDITMESQYYEDLVKFIQSQEMNRRVWPDSANTEALRRNFRRKANGFKVIDGTLHYVHPKTKKFLRVVKVSLHFLGNYIQYFLLLSPHWKSFTS